MHEEKAEVLKSSDMNVASKKQKLCAQEIEEGNDALQEPGNFHLWKSIVKLCCVFFCLWSVFSFRALFR